MELKVWVEGIQRIVCGVTVNTTCQDVVFALAHATGKVGRFTLIERWRNNERLLAPNENPMRLLLKWGEYANDVQFILQRSESKQQQQQQQPQQRVNVTGDSININNNNSSNNSNINNTSNDNKNTQSSSVMMKKPLGISNNNIESSLSGQRQQQLQQLKPLQSHERAKEIKKSFGAYDTKNNENIGIVRGIPQRQQTAKSRQPKMNLASIPPTMSARSPPSAAVIANSITQSPQKSPLPHLTPKHEKSQSNPIDMSTAPSGSGSGGGGGLFNENNLNNNNNNNNNIYNQIGMQSSKSINEINLAEVRSSLDRRTANASGSGEFLFAAPAGNDSSSEQLLDIYNANAIGYNGSPDLYKNTPAISANGALVPPPYRDPPPPRNSPLQIQQQQQLQQQRIFIDNGPPGSQQNLNPTTNPFLSDYNNSNSSNNNNNADYDMDFQHSNEDSESIFPASQYNDLLQLIRYQREKISSQQMELTKYDAEIVFLEGKERDQSQELEAISLEITKADQMFRQGSEQLQSLQYVEEENELVKQQEKTLKSEIALLRSKLANCETELLQCKNKVRLLMDDIELEQRAITNKQKSNRQNVERDFLIEMERIQSEIDQAVHNTDTSNKTTENLKKEILLIENAISEKKRQVEQLVNEMKEVNLQSLTVPTSEEIKHLLEGPNKPGSSRRIIGSPRQLENAVPTSKNPHGVWV